jgi:GSH-dependent disulfide-bond oxidoreductase
MLEFYYNGAPNPMKVALLLEELGAPYESIPVDTRKGEQHSEGFLRINPNAKLPAIVDGGQAVFDSNAILLYLAEKHGRFLPDASQSRGQLYSWLMFIASGLGPYSGQAVHFRHVAPEQNSYSVNRYLFEAKRHYAIIETKLGANRYMLGDSYTIVDMALWGWGRIASFVIGEEAVARLVNFNRFMDEINARPAASRANALREKHAFKTEMDEQARRALYPSNYADAAQV